MYIDPKIIKACQEFDLDYLQGVALSIIFKPTESPDDFGWQEELRQFLNMVQAQADIAYDNNLSSGRWKPGFNQEYWTVEDGEPYMSFWDDHELDIERFNDNKVFKTKEEAKESLELPLSVTTPDGFSNGPKRRVSRNGKIPGLTKLKNGKWYVRAQRFGQRYHIGTFKTRREAMEAYAQFKAESKILNS